MKTGLTGDRVDFSLVFEGCGCQLNGFEVRGCFLNFGDNSGLEPFGQVAVALLSAVVQPIKLCHCPSPQQILIFRSATVNEEGSLV